MGVISRAKAHDILWSFGNAFTSLNDDYRERTRNVLDVDEIDKMNSDYYSKLKTIMDSTIDVISSLE